MMDRWFEFLFKYQPIVFRRGEIAFASGLSTEWIVLLLVGLLILAFLSYSRTGTPLPTRTKFGLIALRTGLLWMLFVCLLQPVIRLSVVIPQRSFVALLADDSQSMSIADEADGRRIDVVQRLLSASSAFHQRLNEKFKLRLYAFSRKARRDPTLSLTASGEGTDLAAAIETALDDFRGLPLSAIVLMSDGANTVNADFLPLINTLKARRVPLYIVGLGRAHFDRDIELAKVDLPRSILQGSTIRASLTIKSDRVRRARVLVQEGERTIRSRMVELPHGHQVQPITIDFTPAGAGLKRYTFVVEPLPDELIDENNRREAMVMVRDAHPRILYVEGEPRWEYGKLRAALNEEKNVTLTSLLRTAKNKYYRQGVETPDELADGFPQTKEDLFRFKGLILGSVEATFFSFEQLKNIEAFVAERGGGFLMLGGRRAFSAGGYATTPIADLLPIYLNDQAPAAALRRVHPRLTFNGTLHAITRLSDDAVMNAEIWNALPAVTVREVPSGVKPGAIILLEGRSDHGPPVPLLVYQRYGRGRSLAFMAEDSWRWQMQRPFEDQSHERFWKQLLRYLVNEAPDPVMVTTDRDAYDLGDVVRIRADVYSRAFHPLRDATVTARISAPNGRRDIVQLEWTPEGGGYVGEWTSRERGIHRLEVTAQRQGDIIGRAHAGFIVGDVHREFRDAEQHVDFLRRLAEETGGRYYTSETAHRLPEEIVYQENAASMRITKELWDMPINFLVLIGLASLEWLLRKRHRLP